MQVDFYHLTVRPIERVLPRIAERVLEGGGRLLVVEADASRREAIDKLLWRYDRAAFLPHGLLGGDEDERQPILIAGQVDAANAARNIALADGQWRDDALGFDRAFHFFDEGTIAAARNAFRALRTRAGVEPRYWKQNDSGRWEQAG